MKAVDFSKVNTKGYKIWRILSAPGHWVQVYRDREKMLRGCSGAILFPEQFLGLNQKCVFKVTVSKMGDIVTSNITAYRKFIPHGIDGTVLDTLEKIREYESENSTAGAAHRINVGRAGQEYCFYNFAFFTSSSAAAKYQAKLQASYLSQIG